MKIIILRVVKLSMICVKHIYTYLQVANSEPAVRPGKGVIFATIGSLLVDLIAFTIILPLLPSIIQNYKKTDSSGLYSFISGKADTLGQIIGAPSQSETVLIGGILGSIFCLLQFISSPILGAISDSFGRKTALLICLVNKLYYYDV